MKQQVYALQNEKDVLAKSSSGGAFLGIVKAFFKANEKNMYVYGVVLDANACPQYAKAESYEEAEKFCGSKYVYCSIRDVIEDLSTKLLSGATVLVSGTPCNISILKTHLRKHCIPEDKLVTVDLVCNGTPSIEFWKEYVAWLEGKCNSKLIDFKFRKKGDRYNPYLTEAIFENGKVLRDHHLTASYNQLFLKKLIIRKGCFSCKFKNLNRVADLTIGDFWGIKEILPHFNTYNEVSQVLVNSEKGKLILNQIDDIVRMMECFDDNYLQYQQNLVSPTRIPDTYELFWNDKEINGLDYVMKKYSDAGYVGKIRYFLKRNLRKYRKG